MYYNHTQNLLTLLTKFTFPDSEKLAQARNDNVRLPGSPYSALDTVRGKSAGVRSAIIV